MSSDRLIFESPWPHRLAVLLACATFPLIWVGGLVTTTDAGMAVPDWPSTYGYNLFLYPWSTWLAAPWDLFVEHGHRLLGATVGMIAIALTVVLWIKEPRSWVRWLGLAALVLVILQGVLGGMRVRHDSRELAMLHGCTGPLFFALTAGLVVVTSRVWRGGPDAGQLPFAAVGSIRRLAIATAVLVYLQIVFGAVLRHVPVESEPGAFIHAVRAHLILAAVLTLHILLLTALVQVFARHVRPVARLSWVLIGLLIVQVLLGASTWLVKFAVPAWAEGWIPAHPIAFQEGGWAETHVITAHVAVGSLLLVTAVSLALRAARLLPAATRDRMSAIGRLGAAV